MTMSKTCPRCQKEKPKTSFYAVKSRADGLASWCKLCSNEHRKFHKKTERRPEYRIVADAVRKDGKPRQCPTCQNMTPAHMMRGQVQANGGIVWRCQRCHSLELVNTRAANAVLYCDWCCDPFPVPAAKGKGVERRFCGPECRNIWLRKQDERRPVRLVRRVVRQEQPQVPSQPHGQSDDESDDSIAVSA